MCCVSNVTTHRGLGSGEFDCLSIIYVLHNGEIIYSFKMGMQEDSQGLLKRIGYFVNKAC